VYGVGCVDHQDDCVDCYLQQTQAYSSKKVDFEEIVELRQRLSTSEKHTRHMNSRFQSFQELMIQYLLPKAVAAPQHIFQ